MAIASRWLGGRYNREGLTLFDFDVYAQAGDGCMMEGVASEAASFAAHQRLSNLCWIYDANRVTIEGHTDLTFTEDVAARFVAYGWNVQTVPDANDLEAAERAFQAFRAEDERPTLIVVHSHIGYGTPVEDTPKAHGEPLGPDGVAATKRFGWPGLVVPRAGRRGRALRGGDRRARSRGTRGLESCSRSTALRCRSSRTRSRACSAARCPTAGRRRFRSFPATPKRIASRDSSGQVLNAVAERVPWIVGEPQTSRPRRRPA